MAGAMTVLEEKGREEGEQRERGAGMGVRKKREKREEGRQCSAESLLLIDQGQG